MEENKTTAYTAESKSSPEQIEHRNMNDRTFIIIL
jgi:hypothetical protein